MRNFRECQDICVSKFSQLVLEVVFVVVTKKSFDLTVQRKKLNGF